MSIKKLISLMLFVIIIASAQPALGRQALIVYDTGAQPGAPEWRPVAWVLDLANHFEIKVDIIPADAYVAEMIDEYDALIYIGLWSGALLPDSFLADCYESVRPVMWLGANLDRLEAKFSLGRYGFQHLDALPESSPNRVTYREMPYWRGDAPLPRMNILRPDICEAIAVIEDAGGYRPYAIRSGRFWYFPELMMTADRRGSVSLILCSEMHRFLEESHTAHSSGIITLTGITPESDPRKVSSVARRLRDEGTPFAVEVSPFVQDDKTGQRISLSDRRRLVSVLRGVQREKSAIIAVLPVEGDKLSEAAFNEAIDELLRCGLYPLGIALERAALHGLERRRIAESVSFLLDKRITQPDGSFLPPLPFLTSDGSGQRVAPDNTSPLITGQGEVESILEIARRQKVVPDPWVTVRVAETSPLEEVSLLVNRLRDMNYELVDLRHRDAGLKTDSIIITSIGFDRKFDELVPEGWEALLFGPASGETRRIRIGDTRPEMVLPGTMTLAFPKDQLPKIVFSFEGDAQQIVARMVFGTARIIVVFGLLTVIMLLVIFLFQIAQRLAV